MDIISAHIINFMDTVPQTLQLVVLFLFSFAEGMPIIGSILPGGTIALFAGSLVEERILSAIPTILIISCASFIGDTTGFLLGRRFKHLRWIKKIVSNEKYKKAWDLFE